MTVKIVEQKQSPQTRQILIDVGMRLIAEKGYDSASIGDIAAFAEVTKGAVYYHFGSKENFVLEIIKQRSERNIAQFKQRAKDNISLAEWIENSFSMIIGFPDLAQQQFLLQVMMASIRPGHEKIAALMAEIHAEWRGLLTEMLKMSDEYRKGQFLDDPEVIAVGIMALIDGLLIHSRVEPESFAEKEFIKRLAPLLKLWVLQVPSEN
jgi:AcrR family transcriptional regulator